MIIYVFSSLLITHAHKFELSQYVHLPLNVPLHIYYKIFPISMIKNKQAIFW